MSNDIEREAFEAEMGRIFDLDDEALRKLPSQRTVDDQGTEVCGRPAKVHCSSME